MRLLKALTVWGTPGALLALLFFLSAPAYGQSSRAAVRGAEIVMKAPSERPNEAGLFTVAGILRGATVSGRSFELELIGALEPKGVLIPAMSAQSLLIDLKYRFRF